MGPLKQVHIHSAVVYLPHTGPTPTSNSSILHVDAFPSWFTPLSLFFPNSSISHLPTSILDQEKKPSTQQTFPFYLCFFFSGDTLNRRKWNWRVIRIVLLPLLERGKEIRRICSMLYTRFQLVIAPMFELSIFRFSLFLNFML